MGVGPGSSGGWAGVKWRKQHGFWGVGSRAGARKRKGREGKGPVFSFTPQNLPTTFQRATQPRLFPP